MARTVTLMILERERAEEIRRNPRAKDSILWGDPAYGQADYVAAWTGSSRLDLVKSRTTREMRGITPARLLRIIGETAR